MKRGAILFLLIVLFTTRVVQAETDISYDDIEREAKQQLDMEVSVKDVLDAFMHGSILDTIKDTVYQKVRLALEDEIELKELFVQLLMIGFLMAIFHNFSEAFVEQYVGSTGFFIAYMILAGIMIRQFLMIYEFTKTALDQIVTFMKVLVPTYSMVLLTVTGITTSLASYEIFLTLITGVQWGILTIILPCIKFGFVLKLLNFLSKEDLFSGIIELLESLIKLFLKGAIMVVLLFNIFQSMLLPAIDSVKSNLLQKGINALPGVGQVLGMVANTAIGSSIILKNAIGVFGMLVICLIAFLPVLKIFLYTGSFQLAGAILQPVTDKKVYQVLHDVAGSGKLLLQSILTAVVLFLLTIAIISLTTNMNYYVG